MSFDSNPYVNQDEYAAEWASVIDDALADPADGLDDLLDIVERILADEAGVRSPSSLEPELGRRLAYAREIKRKLEEGNDIERGDLDAALAAVIAVYNATLPVGIGPNDPGEVEPAAAEQLEVEMEAADTGETQTDP
jgi:hypothetical protein